MSHVRSPLTCCRVEDVCFVSRQDRRHECEEDAELYPEEFHKAVDHYQTQRFTSCLSENAGARLGDLRVYENSFKATKILLNLPALPQRASSGLRES